MVNIVLFIILVKVEVPSALKMINLLQLMLHFANQHKKLKSRRYDLISESSPAIQSSKWKGKKC